MSDLIIHDLGLRDYLATWQAMRLFTEQRTAATPDELWFLEHPPIFTLGQAGKPAHILQRGEIPVLQTDRGGQVTYHAPGQQIVYFLVDLRRRELTIRNLVTLIEQAVIDLLAEYQISAQRREQAPGVYVGNKKIAALGLRIRHGYSYHGLALNVEMDLKPFSWINPCGYAGMEVTQLSDLQPGIKMASVKTQLINKLRQLFGDENSK